MYIFWEDIGLKLSEHCLRVMGKLEENNAALKNLLETDGKMNIRYKQVRAYLQVIEKGNDPTDLETYSCRAALRDI